MATFLEKLEEADGYRQTYWLAKRAREEAEERVAV